jgi:hypothetical protein
VPEPGNPQALNRYAYTLNNPVKYVDPSGHFIIPMLKYLMAIAQSPTGPHIAETQQLVQDTTKCVERTVDAYQNGERRVSALASHATGFTDFTIDQSEHLGQLNTDVDVVFSNAPPEQRWLHSTRLGLFAVGTAATIVGVVQGARALSSVVRGTANSGTGVAQGRSPGPTVDPITGEEVGRFIVDPNGNVMIEPVGGQTVPAGRGGVDTHTLYPNGSNYQRLNPVGHGGNPQPHAHGHLLGTGPYTTGQGPSIDIHGNVVPWNSPDAHWTIN